MLSVTANKLHKDSAKVLPYSCVVTYGAYIGCYTQRLLIHHALCIVQRNENTLSRCEAYLLSRRPVGWLSKKAIGRRMTLANRLACSLREALKEPSTSSSALPPCTNKDTRPKVK